MKKLLASINKEARLVTRDWSGLALLFIMPVALVIVMTLIQDVTFRKLDETSLRVLVINNDHGEFGTALTSGLAETGFFIIDTIASDGDGEKKLVNSVSDGVYQVGIIIESGSTEFLKERSRMILQENFSATMPMKIYFDPVIRDGTRQLIRQTLENYMTRVEARFLFESLSDQWGDMFPLEADDMLERLPGIEMEESYAMTEDNPVIPNSVQHNVPGWTVFAMFFIVIPLTGNLIKERSSGASIRLRMMPVPAWILIGGKVIVYFMVCFLQFIILMLVGMLLMPVFGLPALDPGNNIASMIVIAGSIALAAIGFGLIISSVAETHDQAASFGTVAVIILAALGGAWVPTFVMPEAMQKISILSPMNWGLEGFYSIFLRGGGFTDILPYSLLLLVFFFVTATAGWYWDKKKRSSL